MYPVKYMAALTAAACLLLLAACGGGGGGDGGAPMTGMGEPPSEPPTFITALTTDQDKFIAATIAAATARPAFGSGVTQSSNQNAAGVSTDSARSSFDGDTYTLRIARRNGSTLSLNTDDHQETSRTSTPPITGRDRVTGRLLDYDARSITAAKGAVEFDPGFGGWMAIGHWVHLTGNWAEGEASRVEVGAFVDGPEFSGSASVPAIGTATYKGGASGHFSTKVQSSGRTIRETGEYLGAFRLTADFQRGLVSGAILSGSVGSIRSLGDGTTSGGARKDDSTIHLGSTSINSDGSFTGTDVTLTTAVVNQHGPSEGYWGGRFSTIDDSTGTPRAVAGTHGVTMTAPGNISITYVGHHFGATDDF